MAASSSSSSSATDVHWRSMIDNEQCPIKKQMLISAYSRVQQAAALTPAKHDPALTRGGKPNRVSEVYFFCTGSEEEDYGTFKKTIAHSTRFGLPFIEVTPVDGKIMVDSDLSSSAFTQKFKTDWLGGNLARVSSTGTTNIQISKSLTIVPGWYRFPNFTVDQNKGKNGIIYTNPSSDPPQKWNEAPSPLALHALLCRLYSNSRYMLRPVNPDYFPPQALITDMENELKGKKTASSVPEGGAAEDNKKSDEYKLHAQAYTKAFDAHIDSMGIDWPRHPELKQQHPKARHPFIIPLNIGRHAAALVTPDPKQMVTHMPVFWDDDIRVKNGNEVKSFEVTSKNVFATHMTASANTTVILSDLETGDMKVLTIALAVRTQTFFYQLGFVNPNIAQGVLPRVLPKIPMTVIASLNMQQTQSKNALSGSLDQSSQCLVFDVFNPPLVDYLSMIRDNSVQVTAEFAVRAVNKYIKSRNPNAQISDTRAKASVLDTGKGSVQNYITEQNPLTVLSGGLIANCYENKFAVEKNGSKQWRFYAMTGHMPREDALQDYYQAVEAFHASEEGSDEAIELDAALAKYAAEFSADLSASIDDSKYFTHNGDLIKNDIQPTMVIWAISRKLDHEVIIDYKNEMFSTEAVYKRAEFIRQFNVAREEPVKPSTPVHIEETPSLELTDDVCDAQPTPTVIAVSVDDDCADEDQSIAVQASTSGRKRREPTSPMKKNAVSKRSR